MALPPPSVPVDVVLPLLGDPVALVDAVAELAARWPEHVDAQLVVPAPRLTERDRAVLASLGDDVRVVELEDAAPSFGRLVVAAGGTGPVVVLDPAALPDGDAVLALAEGRDAPGGLALDPAVLAGTPLLTVARDLPSLAALLTTTAPLPGDELPDTAGAREPAFDRDAPVRAGLVSVVLPVRDRLAETRACLASLRRDTPRPYEVVVVDDGSTDGTGAWLATQRDLVVLTNTEGRGTAAARNQGIAASRGETVVLLDRGTVLPRFWVEGLLRALDSDGRVGAVGPRATGTPGPQAAPGGDDADPAAFRARADAWRREHTGRSEQAHRLAGPLLALCREALLEVGGLDEAYGSGDLQDDDLCLRLRRAGWSLRVASDVLVHRSPGRRGTAAAQAQRHHRAKWGRGLGEEVLVSAALIVKDEEAALPRCLASLRGVVDELVVCDTGSSDRTVEVAEAFGARVVSAPWQDDFAAARNAVLAHCRGTWVLSVDADEQLSVAPGTDLALQLLALPGDAAALTVRSRSDEQGGATFEHAAGRLFRRGSLAWVGAVHETLVDTRTGLPPAYTATTGLVLDHDGYVGRVYEQRGKTTRNLLLAEKDHEQALAAGDAQRVWKTAYELARALCRTTGTEVRVEQLLLLALDTMPAGLAHLRCDAHVRLASARAHLGRPEEAEASARAAVAAGPSDPAALLVLSQVLAVDGRLAEALDVLDASGVGAVPDGSAALLDLGKATVDLPLMRARLLHRLGRGAEAAAVLLDLVDDQPDALDWPLLHACLREQDAAPSVLAGAVARRPEAALAALDGLPADERDALHAALAGLGLDAAAHTPEALRASRLDGLLRGHDPRSVEQAALVLEDTDLTSALDLWSRVPATGTVRVARARCLLQLGRTDEAVAAVEGLDPTSLLTTDLLVVVAVAAAAGDRDTADLLLAHAAGTAPDELGATVTSLARTLGLALPGRVQPVP